MSPIAYTTDRTFVAGELETASIFNTYLRDNMAWVSTDAPYCRVYKSTAFSHNSSGNWLAVTHDTERFDNASLHDTGSNTDRITVPTGAAGKWAGGACGSWSANATGVRRLGIGYGGIVTFLGVQEANSVANATLIQGVSFFYSLAAADYVVMAGYQSSGGTRTIDSAASYSPEFWAYLVRF